nr:sporulation protein YpjB [Paenibacillus sp. MMS18-CY102]
MLTIAFICAAAAAASSDATAVRNPEQKAWTRLNSATASLYAASTDGNRQSAYQAAQQVATALRDGQVKIIGTTEGWQQAEQDVQSLLSKLKAGQSSVYWRAIASRIKLSIDAAWTLHQGVPESALWLQYNKVISEDLSRVRSAMARPNKEGYESARASFDTLSQHAERIMGAALLMRGEEAALRFSNSVAYAERLLSAGKAGELTRRLADGALSPVEKTAAVLFASNGQRVEDEPVLAPIGGGVPHRWIFGLSALISSMLTYVSWRKYKSVPYAILTRGSGTDSGSPLFRKRKL